VEPEVKTDSTEAAFTESTSAVAEVLADAI